jgi:hypothetical protein
MPTFDELEQAYVKQTMESRKSKSRKKARRVDCMLHGVMDLSKLNDPQEDVMGVKFVKGETRE